MAWSPNRSSGKRAYVRSGSPFVPVSSPPSLRATLFLSGAVHLLLALLALLLPPLSGKAPRLEPVAVVDLVGGGEPRGGGPEPEAKAAATPKREPRGDELPPAEKRSAAKARKKGKAERVEVPPPDSYSLSRSRAREAASLSERLRKMREARDAAESVRGAIEERRREAAARAAVRGVGERVGRRIEAPDPVRRGGAGAGSGGGRGNVRLSPELIDYFRRLEEAVRNSWVLPEALVRDADKLVVELRILIEKDGRVSESRIEKGSGNLHFDDSVRRAIRKASPLPVPPEQLRGGEDHYEVGFRFHGSGGGSG